jgi:hypothetical protein
MLELQEDWPSRIKEVPADLSGTLLNCSYQLSLRIGGYWELEGCISGHRLAVARAGLTNRWSGRVKDKVPSPVVGVRAAQLNR